MGQVTIHLNDKPYSVGCEDGQEDRLLELGRLFDGHVRQVAGSIGQLPDSRLFVMAALMMADELAEAQGQLALARSQLQGARSGHDGVEDKAARALDSAARRIEALTARIGTGGA